MVEISEESPNNNVERMTVQPTLAESALWVQRETRGPGFPLETALNSL